MPTFSFRDAGGTTRYLYVDEGDGSNGDPFDFRLINDTGLDTIDTEAELLAYQFRQNSTGTALTPLRNSWLLRALNGLSQIIAGRLGANNDVASASGSMQAKLGVLINSLAPTLAAPTAYRSNITAADVAAAPTFGALASGAGGGSLSNGTAHGVTVVGVNGYGRTGRANIQQFTPSNNTIRVPITVTADYTHFDIYLSNSITDPLFLGRVSTAQVTAGDTITAAATTTANATFSGSGTAGSIDVRVQGTGPASSTVVGNSAFLIPTTVDCTGKDYILFDVEISGGTPFNGYNATLVPFFTNSTSSTFFQGDPISLTFASGLNSSRQRIRVEAAGSTGVALAVQSLTGAAAALNVWRVLR